MKNIIATLFLASLFACSSKPSSSDEPKSSVAEFTNSQFADTSEASKKWDNPAYADSMKQEIKKASDNMSNEIIERQKNYTPEDWEREYTLKGEYYITLENIDIRYNDDFEPIMYVTIYNQTGLTIKSIKLIVDGRSEKRGTPDNIFTFKKSIPAKSKINVSFKVKESTTVNDVYFYSFISSSGRLSESRIALSDYVRKVYPN